jgi:hypothetical protein
MTRDFGRSLCSIIGTSYDLFICWNQIQNLTYILVLTPRFLFWQYSLQLESMNGYKFGWTAIHLPFVIGYISRKKMLFDTCLG